jgi:hypothetical protein
MGVTLVEMDAIAPRFLRRVTRDIGVRHEIDNSPNPIGDLHAPDAGTHIEGAIVPGELQGSN